jgi:hypothetical protein
VLHELVSGVLLALRPSISAHVRVGTGRTHAVSNAGAGRWAAGRTTGPRRRVIDVRSADSVRLERFQRGDEDRAGYISSLVSDLQAHAPVTLINVPLIKSLSVSLRPPPPLSISLFRSHPVQPRREGERAPRPPIPLPAALSLRLGPRCA